MTRAAAEQSDRGDVLAQAGVRLSRHGLCDGRHRRHRLRGLGAPHVQRRHVGERAGLLYRRDHGDRGVWLKRLTPQNIVIGGAAGALPPVIGWVAAAGTVGLEPLLLFLIIMLWTPPHFWALSLDRVGEYARAGIPMLPVVAGAAATKRQILVYSAMLAAASLLPFALGLTGVLYGAVACGCGAALLHRAIRLYTGGTDSEVRLARRLFAF